MRIKKESDIHIGFRPEYKPYLKDIDLYIIAGDLACRLQGLDFIKTCLEENPTLQIIEVPGNHLFYTSELMEKVLCLLKEKAKDIERYYFLENDSIIINGTKFIGACLWTDFNKMNPTDIQNVWAGLRDYEVIHSKKLGYKRITPYFINTLHNESRKYIFETIKDSEEDCVVITHHQPFISSYNKGKLRYGYEVDLSKEIKKYSDKIKYWFSGHTHESHNIEKHGIKFVSNQLGYPPPHEDYNITGYDPNFMIEI